MNKNEVVSLLVRRALDATLADDNRQRLRTLFCDGFIGLNNMTRTQLTEALRSCDAPDFARPAHAPGDNARGTVANRNQVVSLLIQHSLETALADPQQQWLRKLLLDGFRGFNDMTDAQLTKEMQFRGMLEFPDPEPETGDDAYEAAEAENEMVVMLGGTMYGAEREPGYD